MTAACGVQQRLREHVADNVRGGEVTAGIAILVDGGHEDSIRRHAHQKNAVVGRAARVEIATAVVLSNAPAGQRPRGRSW